MAKSKKGISTGMLVAIAAGTVVALAALVALYEKFRASQAEAAGEEAGQGLLNGIKEWFVKGDDGKVGWDVFGLFGDEDDD